MTNPLQPAVLLESPDFSDVLEESGKTRAQLIEGLLFEALANPKANRARYGVSADELGLKYSACAIRGDLNVDGTDQPFCLFNPKILDSDSSSQVVLSSERDRTGAWILRDRPWELLVEYLDVTGQYHLDHFDGNLCPAIAICVDHLAGK